jgi:dipeptidyl aminopeptidase/acylaminoacyl peptidase
MAPTVAPYGSWKSPISVEQAVASRVVIGFPLLDGGEAYWLEGRPEEGGRTVLVRGRDRRDLTPAGSNVRSRVHEYGGGAATVADGVAWFSNFVDGRIYRQADDADPTPLTPPGPFRYADLTWDPTRQRLLAVREDHSSGLEATEPGPGDGHTQAAEPENTLVALSVDGSDGHGRVLARGRDFFLGPRPSPDGSQLAWLAWDHPLMPWDGTELWVASVDGTGALVEPRCIAGGPDESIVQPEWAVDGSLWFSSDRSGRWNLQRWAHGPVAPMDADIGGPLWQFGLTYYALLPDGSALAVARERSRDRLLQVLPGREPREVATGLDQIVAIVADGTQALLLGGSATRPRSLLRLDLGSRDESLLRGPSEVEIDARYISEPRSIEFPTEGGLTAFGLFYPPYNPDFVAPEGERPPLVVATHGGPTDAAWAMLDPAIQLLTSRGIAYLDVDYGGSTGYGRAYRQRLDGQWGVVDVDDAVNGARYLAESGLVDGRRMAIEGGSAGGFTTLAALAFRDLFTAGVSHFGVADLETFVHDTHKFESRYLERLVGRWPEQQELYRDRSPIHHADRLSAPLLILQGLDDRVVPPSQAEQMVEALRERGIPYAYMPFEGEGHGFRKAENLRRVAEAVLAFYAAVFDLRLADDIAPLELERGVA